MQRQTVRRGSITVTETPDRQPSQAPVVLVVTGDTDLREASARALAREGYTVITAAHAGHAVLACITAGRVDLLLAELSMEDMSGPALAARLRRQIPDLATIFVAEAGTLGCEGLLVRPFTRDDLLEALATRTATATRNLTSAF